MKRLKEKLISRIHICSTKHTHTHTHTHTHMGRVGPVNKTTRIRKLKQTIRQVVLYWWQFGLITCGIELWLKILSYNANSVSLHRSIYICSWTWNDIVHNHESIHMLYYIYFSPLMLILFYMKLYKQLI